MADFRRDLLPFLGVIALVLLAAFAAQVAVGLSPLRRMRARLAAIGHAPMWLAVLVVSRDVLIVGGVILSWLASRPVPIVPLMISKANTFAQIALAARNSSAKSRSLTASSEFAIGRSNPSAAAVISRSIGNDVPASAAAPSGLSFIRVRASRNRPRSRSSIST